MNSVEVLKDLAYRPLEAAKSIQDQLTAENLNWHPGHDNSIAWLLWHSAREIDVQLSQLSGKEPVWTAQGYQERFDLSLAEDDMGFGHSPEQARSVVVEDPRLLMEHLEAVINAQLDYLNVLSDGELAQIVDRRWEPPVSRGARLLSISLDAFAHVSQAQYILGIQR
ncbi:DinB family protein [Glutamicibacter creatinolyticus]|uniref:mycothiol transferase n=1 Tax=Glutamicibacter TaxID=1742989 RepID=UPI0037C179AD